MASSYTAKDILVLEGLEPVRRRPGMYIGGVDAAGLHHLIWELVDNSVDEAMNGHADRITVTLHKDGASATVADNGRGIPVDRHAQYKKPALELILTTLHAGGKFEAKNYYHSGGLHGVGASVVTALAEKLVARVRRDGAEWEQTFSRGKPASALKKVGPARGSGTSVFFRPDPKIFPDVRFDPKRIAELIEAKAVRNYLTVHNLVPRGITIAAEDVREGLVAVLAIKIPQPQFQGQTKERLNNTEVTPLIDGIVRSALENALNANRTTGDVIASRVVLAARARSASRAAAAEVQRKGAVSHRLNLPGKLADCSSTDPSECELFIVEGDSAGGSAKQGRDRAFQAILPLRGKVLNTEQASTAKVLTNKELSDLVSALRALLRVAIRDAARTEQTIRTLMGREVAPRFELIMERAPKVEEVDV